ncbi:MAG TPA: hypothetical protein VH538_10285 [Gaiellaceae bacterium]|jgi:hypothetical protein
MNDVYAAIFANRARLAVALALIAVVIAGGVTLGSWAVGSDAGNGYAAATAPQNLTLGTTVSAFTTGLLYPGGHGDVKVKITNPNQFPVTIGSIKGAGTITASDPGCTATSVTFTDQTGLALSLAATATNEFVLAGAASMDNTANAACENATFTIPVTVTASS